MILTCRCGAVNRLPRGAGKVRCGKCKRVWTPAELAGAKPEAEPVRDFALEQEDDGVPVKCKCGWEGIIDDADPDEDKQGNEIFRCPDCEAKLKVPDDV